MKHSLILVVLLLSCGDPALPWPSSPVHPELIGEPARLADRGAALQRLAGRYGHYDVVAYEEVLRGAPMRTFVISYGITELIREGDTLLQRDRFCHAEHRINRAGMRSWMEDAAVRAIVPPDQPVRLREEAGRWSLHRPATPTLIGVRGDPSQPLPERRRDLDTVDADGDGRPGITVHLEVEPGLRGRVWMARREIFEAHLTPLADGRLVGHVEDRSEQRTLGASSPLFAAEADPHQVEDPGLSPLLLVPLPDEVDGCDALMARAGELFPEAPGFLGD
ncbi:MAG: hypothetical protein JXX28_15970 [Deltaproteobacteria bacterium]|nr:hypothetical protein [Deltaproteobacteria bacterium]